MNRVLLFCGLPGVGKTTLAEAISRELHIACIHKDSIKECLWEGMGGKTLEDSRRIGELTIKLLYTIVENQIKNGVDVIVESPFHYPEDYPILQRWITQYNCELTSIICEIDSVERERRFRSRSRHEAHRDGERQFEDSDFDFREIPGKQIRVSTNRPMKSLVSDVISRLSI